MLCWRLDGCGAEIEVLLRGIGGCELDGPYAIEFAIAGEDGGFVVHDGDVLFGEEGITVMVAELAD